LISTAIAPDLNGLSILPDYPSVSSRCDEPACS
jgi:hypothetical protein